MDFFNETGWGAGFLNTVMGEERLLGAVIARPTFRLDNGELAPDPDGQLPVDPSPRETEFGSFPGDTPFLSGGVDVFVVGRAHAPEGKPAQRIRVEIRIGEGFSRSIEVLGDRRWINLRSAGGNEGATPSSPVMLVPSEPEPFTEMLLTYGNAYGGKAEYNGYECAYPDNPGGKGFYLTAEQAEGKPLPNLEDPENLVRKFDDRPMAVGTAPYPQDGSLRSLNAVDLHEDSQNPQNTRIRQIKPLIFNAAHPAMIIPPGSAPGPGTEVEVTNVLPEGSVKFTIPDLRMHAHVQLEKRSYLFPLHLDQIGLLPEEGRVFFSLRAAFKYRMVPMERRAATLHDGPAPAETPPEYVRTRED